MSLSPKSTQLKPKSSLPKADSTELKADLLPQRALSLQLRVGSMAPKAGLLPMRPLSLQPKADLMHSMASVEDLPLLRAKSLQMKLQLHQTHRISCTINSSTRMNSTPSTQSSTTSQTRAPPMTFQVSSFSLPRSKLTSRQLKRKSPPTRMISRQLTK